MQKDKTDDVVEDVAFALRDGQIVPADPAVENGPQKNVSLLHKLVTNPAPLFVPNVLLKDTVDKPVLSINQAHELDGEKKNEKH